MQSAGPSQILKISGSVVGVLDPTQATRLLSSPGSKLAFATFHPEAASVASRKLSTQDELCSQKRVVIETLPSGENFWRWVPRAKGADSPSGEGSWPRVINICGQYVECSQDQWDIYKLDPAYECTVRPQPELTTITRRESQSAAHSNAQPSNTTAYSKRRVNEDREERVHQAKRQRPIVIDTDESNEEDTDSDDEDAVVEMIIDHTMPGGWAKKRRLHHEQTARDRARRREKMAARANKEPPSKDPRDASDLSMIDLTLDEPDVKTEAQTGKTNNTQYFNIFESFPPPPRFTAPTGGFSANPQNGANGVPSPTKRSGEFDGANGPTAKRMRTRCPSPMFVSRFEYGGRGAFKRKREEAQKLREQRARARSVALKEARQRAQEESIRADARAHATFVPSRSQSKGPSPYDSESSSRTPPQPEPEMEDPISLEEKIRRMAEINAYEEARVAKELERQRAERAEEERRRKQEEHLAREKVRMEREAREREAELERQRKRRQEEEERRKRERERDELRKKLRQQQDRWSYGVWTTQRALERYKVLSETFDSTQFSIENPVTFSVIPWPVLRRPANLTIEDVDWSAVEDFFKAVRPHMRTQDYKILVEKSHRRFHPDRWRARRVLQSVQDEDLKACLEVAANTVAQALTPIWREAKST